MRYKIIYMLALVYFGIHFAAIGQTTYLLQKDFSSTTSGNNTSSTGANSTIEFETNSKRAYIDNVNVYNAPASSPTLTVTDITNPSLNATAGNSTSQVINISALNLSADLALSITGTNANLFSLSQNSIVQSSGNIPNTAVTITYSPVSTGNHTAILTMSSPGAMDLTRSITGIATMASGINLVHSDLKVYVENDNLKFNAEAGETIDVYNSIGQKLIHSISIDGVNAIKVSTHGILLIKVGNRYSKVIL